MDIKIMFQGVILAFKMYSGMKNIRHGIEYMVESLGGRAYEFDGNTLHIFKTEYKKGE